MNRIFTWLLIIMTVVVGLYLVLFPVALDSHAKDPSNFHARENLFRLLPTDANIWFIRCLGIILFTFGVFLARSEIAQARRR